MTTENMIKKRDETLDIARGIGITSVIIGHIGYPLNTFIYLFHMALFFIISGYLFSDKCWQTWSDVKNFIARKAKTLYLPFILWNMLLIPLHNFFIKINFYFTQADTIYTYRGFQIFPTHSYTILEIFKKITYTLLFYHQEGFGGSTWFLRVLFFVSVFSCFGFYLIHRYIQKNKINFIIMIAYVIAFFIGYILSKINFFFYSIGTMFTASGLFYIGILIKKYGIYSCNKTLSKILITVAALFGLLIACCFHIKIELSANMYPNPILLLIISYLGFMFIYGISTLIARTKILKNIFVFLGQNTLYIILFNTISFRIFSCILVKLFNYPVIILSLPPVTIVKNIQLLWPFYLLSCILGSIILMYICKYINLFCGYLYKKIYNKAG